ncbi:MAG TPA: 6-phosphogluconolactonase, partial [Nitrosomonas sp.]|nr:6-phosphogluconolactonase [Nitrosomonas sp.]
HIASIFPGMKADPSSTYHCLAAAPPAAPTLRVSLALNLLANSENIVVVVTGDAKRRLLDRIVTDADPRLPIVWLLQRSNAEIAIFETSHQ